MVNKINITLEEKIDLICQVFSQMPDSILITDSNFEIISNNKPFEKLYGYSLEEIIGLKPDFLNVETFSESIQKDIYSRVAKGAIWRGLVLNKRKDDSIFLCEMTISALSDENGQPFVYIGTQKDITAKKKMEEALLESHRLRAVAEMSSAIAHDFNNSLFGMLGNLELALFEELPETVREYLNNVKFIVTEAAARVQLLSRFGGENPKDSTYEPVNLNSLIKNVILQSRPLWKDKVEQKGLRVSVKEKYVEVPDIMANSAELRSVFYDIVINSIEAMPDGGDLKFETGINEKGVYATITDTGVGMDKNTMTRVFQPFYSTKGFEVGRGLGLSAAYSIIKEHKGEIYIKKTDIGQGTSIEIVFPYLNEEVKGLERVVSKYEETVRILWVDDEVMIRNFSEKIIKKMGYEGDFVESGKEALKYLESKEYDLVITDLGMPNMNGWELADKIAEKYKGKMKVILVTGWGNQISSEDTYKHHIDYVVGKPFEIEKLKSIIGEVMKTKK